MTGISNLPPPGVSSPTIKRPAPESPQRRRASVERSHSPSRDRDRDRDQGPPKRYRQQSPPRRYPDRERERERPPPPPRGYGRDSKERSPMPPHPPSGIHRGAPQVLPSHAPPPPVQVSQPLVPPRDQLDRSGVTKPLAWFIGSLPSARAFDGESGLGSRKLLVRRRAPSIGRRTSDVRRSHVPSRFSRPSSSSP